MYNWQESIRAFHEESRDCFTLISHASYLIRTNGVCWVLDPRLDDEMHQQADSSIAEDFMQVRFALISHMHTDHYDRRMIQQLAENDIFWVFPDFIPEKEKKFVDSCCRRCVFVHPGQELSLLGIRIRVFNSNHTDYFQGEAYDVPEYGYEITAGEERMLFPGDVRNYGVKLTDFPNADVFGHVWLGRKAALNYSPQMLIDYSKSLLAYTPKRIFLAHLYDLQRDEESMWTEQHAKSVRDEIIGMNPELPVYYPKHGAIVLL